MAQGQAVELMECCWPRAAMTVSLPGHALPWLTCPSLRILVMVAMVLVMVLMMTTAVLVVFSMESSLGI